MPENFAHLTDGLGRDKFAAAPIQDGSGRKILNTQEYDGTNYAGFGTAANIAAATGSPSKAKLVVGPGGGCVNHVPGTAAQATKAIAAVAGAKHVLTSIGAYIACGATAQTPLLVYVRDGATGAGTILWAGAVAAPADGMGKIELSGLQITGSLNTIMTIEFSAAGVAASQEAISGTYYDVV